MSLLFQHWLDKKSNEEFFNETSCADITSGSDPQLNKDTENTWQYISKPDKWGSAQISPDGEKILVKEIKQGKNGVEVNFNLIDVKTCKKSELNQNNG